MENPIEEQQKRREDIESLTDSLMVAIRECIEKNSNENGQMRKDVFMSALTIAYIKCGRNFFSLDEVLDGMKVISENIRKQLKDNT